MESAQSKKITAKMLADFKRKAVSISKETLVKTEYFHDTGTLPLIIRPEVRGLNLGTWAESNRDYIEEQLLKHGALLFRGFNVSGAVEFESFIKTLYGELLEYNERSSPRSQVSGNIYTSTDYPADQSIFLHNENSYQQTWPMRLFFYSAISADEGGETPIADCRKIFNRIRPGIRERFIQKKWMYMRNFGDGFGLPWQTVFQTDDKSLVEAHCRKNGIQVEWKSENRLRTRAIRPAASKHPKTGEMVWFNHATFFHVSTLEPSVRDSMLALFTEEDLPSNSYYGDGSRIEPDVLESLRDAYERETRKFLWQAGDIMMIDNMLVAHGRSAFVGERRVLVGMAQSLSWNDF
jgi:alpha-ketoglutarate-dependent taurine dioxygenase